MGFTQMVAYNAKMDKFLRKKSGAWEVTDDLLSASGYAQREMQLAVASAKKLYDGEWMIMRRQDAQKLKRPSRASGILPVPHIQASETTPVFSSLLPGVEHPLTVDVTTGGERSQGSEEIMALVSRLEAATSANRLSCLRAQVSEYDKMISEMYHYVEAKKLNASNGYKAYRNMRNILLKRRALKNELHIVEQFRSGKLPSSKDVEDMSARLWSPAIEEMMSR